MDNNRLTRTRAFNGAIYRALLVGIAFQALYGIAQPPHSPTRDATNTTSQPTPQNIHYNGPWPADAKIKSIDWPRSVRSGKMYDLCEIVVTGNAELLDDMPEWLDRVNRAYYTPLADNQIDDFKAVITDYLTRTGKQARVDLDRSRLDTGALRIHLQQVPTIHAIGSDTSAWPSEPELEPAPVANSSGQHYPIRKLVVTGDWQSVHALADWPQYVEETTYTVLSEMTIEQLRQRMLSSMQQAGYVFATVSAYKYSLRFGYVKFRVHTGTMGTISITGLSPQPVSAILNAIGWFTGDEFNYHELYTKTQTMKNECMRVKFHPRVNELGIRIIDATIAIDSSHCNGMVLPDAPLNSIINQ